MIYYVDIHRQFLLGDDALTVSHTFAYEMGYVHHRVCMLQTPTGEAVAIISVFPYKGAREPAFELFVYEVDALEGMEEVTTTKIVPHHIGDYRFERIMSDLLANPAKAYDTLEHLGDDVAGLTPYQMKWLAYSTFYMLPSEDMWANKIVGLLHYKIDPNAYAAHIQPILCATTRGLTATCHTWEMDTRCMHCNMINPDPFDCVHEEGLAAVDEDEEED